MEIEMNFESNDFYSNDLSNDISVYVDVYTNDGSDLDWELISIYDNTSDRFRKYSDFSEDEQEVIDNLCGRAAEDNAADVLSGYNEREYVKDDGDEVW